MLGKEHVWGGALLKPSLSPSDGFLCRPGTAVVRSVLTVEECGSTALLPCPLPHHTSLPGSWGPPIALYTGRPPLRLRLLSMVLKGRLPSRAVSGLILTQEVERARFLLATQWVQG